MIDAIPVSVSTASKKEKPLMNREVEKLTAEERIRRRSALDQKLTEEKKKAADTNGSQGGAD